MRRYFVVSPNGDIVEVWEVIVTACASLDDALDFVFGALISGHRGGISK